MAAAALAMAASRMSARNSINRHRRGVASAANRWQSRNIMASAGENGKQRQRQYQQRHQQYHGNIGRIVISVISAGIVAASQQQSSKHGSK